MPISAESPGRVSAETVAEIFREAAKAVRPEAPWSRIEVEFRSFANANSKIRMERGQLWVQISDVLKPAPAEVIQALAGILMAKLFRRRSPSAAVDRYHRYLNRPEVRRMMEETRQTRGRKLMSPPKGDHYDLEEMFEELNLRFFFGLMPRPGLGWSLRKGRSTLGHYDPSHHSIVLSKALDREDIPRLAVEYILYHEMLHIRYPTEHRGARRCIHTAEFKRAEKEFPGYAAAREHLKRV